MKIFFRFLIGVFLCATLVNLSPAQTPTYNLTAKNFKFYGCPSNILEWDIYMEHTNPPEIFVYRMGQYFFSFDTAIANGGTLTYSIVDSDLPSNMIPRNPSIGTASSPPATVLRMAVNLLPPPGTGFIMTNNGFPGTKIVRVRLTTSAESFANISLNLQWRNPPIISFATKIFAYVGNTTPDITTPSTHTIEQSSMATCEKFLLNTPGFNSVNIAIPVTFSWYRASMANSYTLQISTDRKFTSLISNDSGNVDTFKVFAGLNPGTLYYWRVFAENNSIYYDTSLTWYFKTGGNNGQVPAYKLTATNFSLEDSLADDDMLKFDIYIMHTNPPASFEYAFGQFFLSFNDAIANLNELEYSIIGSDLPNSMQPRNPSIRTASSPTATLLALAPNAAPGAGNGYYMTNNGFPGTKIVRMRLRRTTGTFNLAYLGFSWRNPPIVTFDTQIFAYIGTTWTEITTPNTHFIDTSGLGGPLPVELESFTASINKNNVSLQWASSHEVNNSGFDIERKNIASDDWSKISHVTGNGTTNEPRNYTFSERINSGKFNYRLKQIDFNGNSEYFNLVNDVNVGIPPAHSLSQNYPNPFNPSTKIDYDIPYDGKVSIVLYDISGREMSTLVNELKTAGYYSVLFNAGNLSSGIYFYRISSKDFVMTKKMMVVK